MKYCKETTCCHELAKAFPDCLQEICICMKEEGGAGHLFQNRELCINLDKVEQKSAFADKKATMDFSVGISQNGQKQTMLLVELRFRYKSPRNISETNIRNKIIHSKELVKGVIIPDYVFLFSKNSKNEARAHFNRLFSGKRISCIIMDEQEFYHHFFK